MKLDAYTKEVREKHMKEYQLKLEKIEEKRKERELIRQN